MAGLVMGSTLVERVRRMTDHVGSDFVSDDEILDYLNMAYRELYDFLIRTFEPVYFTKRLPILYSGTYHEADLPDDFYKLYSVALAPTCDYGSQGENGCSKRSETTRIYQVQYNEQLPELLEGYALKANKIELFPERDEDICLCIEYIPTPTILTATTQIDGVNGFDDYMVVQAAILVSMKERTDTTELRRYKNDVEQRIEASAYNRGMLEPFRVVSYDILQEYE